jgi:hypothetical protein
MVNIILCKTEHNNRFLQLENSYSVLKMFGCAPNLYVTFVCVILCWLLSPLALIHFSISPISLSLSLSSSLSLSFSFSLSIYDCIYLLLSLAIILSYSFPFSIHVITPLFRPALSNPFTTHHMWQMAILMWQMALFLNRSKLVSFFGKKMVRYSQFPFDFTVFLLKIIKQ